MGKVYLLEGHKNGQTCILGIFTSESAAEETLKKYPKDASYNIMEFPLDKHVTDELDVYDNLGVLEHSHWGDMGEDGFYWPE